MQKVMEEIIKKLQTSTVIFSQSNKSDIDKVSVDGLILFDYIYREYTHLLLHIKLLFDAMNYLL